MKYYLNIYIVQDSLCIGLVICILIECFLFVDVVQFIGVDVIVLIVIIDVKVVFVFVIVIVWVFCFLVGIIEMFVGYLYLFVFQ